MSRHKKRCRYNFWKRKPYSTGLKCPVCKCVVSTLVPNKSASNPKAGFYCLECEKKFGQKEGGS